MASITLLPVIDELTALPMVSSLEELRRSSVSCRLQVAPGSQISVANMFPPGANICGGQVEAPQWWDENIPALQPVWLMRILGAYYFPEYGVLARPEGGAFAMTAQQAQYGAPDLLGMPFTFSETGQTWFRPPDPIPTIPKASVTMAWGGLHNYGHFLLDCLSGVETIRRLAALSDYPFVFPELTAWQRRHIDLLGIEPLTLSGAVWIEDAIYTSCMASFLHKPNMIYRDIANRQLENFGRGPLEKRRKIYLSRDGNPKRIFKSEAELQRRLSEMDFEIIQPETMPVDRQIEAFRDAAVVVGHTGAAFANVLYCAPDTLVVEAQPRGMLNWWVRKLCAIGRCRHSAYFCDSVTLLENHPESGLEFDFDVGQFCGFISALSG